MRSIIQGKIMKQISSFFVVCFCIITLIGCSNTKQIVHEIEAGSTFDPYAAISLEEGEKASIISNKVNASIVGDYEVVYNITTENDESENLTIQITVVDTTPPEIELIGELSIEQNTEEVNLEQYVTIVDLVDSEPVLEVDSDEIDTTKLGATYPIKYTVTDRSGNSNTLETELTIVENRKNISSDQVYDRWMEYIVPFFEEEKITTFKLHRFYGYSVLESSDSIASITTDNNENLLLRFFCYQSLTDRDNEIGFELRGISPNKEITKIAIKDDDTTVDFSSGLIDNTFFYDGSISVNMQSKYGNLAAEKCELLSRISKSGNEISVLYYGLNDESVYLIKLSEEQRRSFGYFCEAVEDLLSYY